MKTILLLSVIFLSGCSIGVKPDCEPNVIQVPVYVKPKFDLPERPVLATIEPDHADGVVVRVVENNMLDLILYTKKLENIIFEIK